MQRADAPILRPHMPELDTLRGIAALAVLFYHGFGYSDAAGNFQGIAKFVIRATRPGWLGVNLFFVLSGFLITGILLNSRNRDGYYSTFYFRRALRILPAYYALLIILAVLGKPLAFVLASFVYLSNVAPLLGIPMAYGPLWSLSVEEHFYLAWPAVVRRLSMRSLAIVAGAMVLVSPILRALWWRWTGHDGGSLTWLAADGIALGALIAVVLHSRYGTRGNAAKLAGAFAVLALVIAAIGLPAGILNRNNIAGVSLQTVPWTFGFGAVLIVALLLGSRYAGVARIPLLPFFGYISYGLYLVHALVFEQYDRIVGRRRPGDMHALVVRFVIVSAVSIAIAALSRYTYEDWFLSMKDRLPSIRRVKQAATS